MCQIPVNRRGFTLVELMIVLAIAVILATIAWPAFTTAINKSRRSDAMSALAQITQAQERWRANNPQYQDTLANLPGASNALSPGGHYDLSLSTVTAATYTAQAEVKGNSPQSADTQCHFMRVTMNGGNISYSSQASAAASANSPDTCWAR
jgi:type IV pilus assembly protein PilE